MFDTLLDNMMSFCTQHQLLGEIDPSKRDYFGPLGEPGFDDKSYNAQMDGYFSWYMIDRPLTSSATTPLSIYKSHHGSFLTGEEQSRLSGLQNSSVGLFRVKNIGNCSLKIHNLLKNQTIVVQENHILFSFSKDSVFEARIATIGNMHTMVHRGILFYPPELYPALRKQTEPGITDPFPFLRKLASRKLRADRYRVPDVIKFYELA